MIKPVVYASNPIRPDVAACSTTQAGDRIKIKTIVRVGLKSWPVEVVGAYRHVDSLATGIRRIGFRR